ncbi:hypothetical protein [Acinetobacter pittii]|uniref:Lipoprotein n=1 Tax=Acinetobacter pittii TaxID=48296 RepID=A0AAE9SAE9_ACIPI|nr:hypothetical protein [Acinetobacter pittii]USU96160.1 hypothetical protein MWH18_07890 [Acinetobacter pittii]
MKKLILVVGLLTLAGCSKEPVAEKSSDSEQYVSGVTSQQEAAYAEEQANSTPEKKELTPDEAKNFAVQLLKKINEDEKFILDAYELKEKDTLEKYVMNDWNEYVQKPFSGVEEKMGIGHAYFPSSTVMYPYTSCDTAFTDLNLYANALYQQVREDTATMRKIVRQEEADYLKSKAKCEARVKLTYEQALAADEAE